jgi:hypothetical protein
MKRREPVAIVLRGELEQLERVLAVHFALEEEGGYMTDVVSEHPELTAEVFELRAQHDVLLDELDDLLAGWCDAASPCFDYARLSALLTLLEQHERRERILMQDGVTRGQGNGRLNRPRGSYSAIAATTAVVLCHPSSRPL